MLGFFFVLIFWDLLQRDVQDWLAFVSWYLLLENSKLFLFLLVVHLLNLLVLLLEKRSVTTFIKPFFTSCNFFTNEVLRQFANQRTSFWIFIFSFFRLLRRDLRIKNYLLCRNYVGFCDIKGEEKRTEHKHEMRLINW